MNPVFQFESNEPEFNTIYAHELNQYLKEGVDWSADPFKGASIEDMQQFGADSFAAGWLAYRSQAVQLFKNALPWLHLYSAQAKTGYDTLHVNQNIKNITEFLEVNVPNPWKTPYGCPKAEETGYGKPQTLVQELTHVINRRSLEHGSNTPDFILADFLSRCLVAFDDSINNRTNWYGQKMKDLEFNHVIDLGPKPNRGEYWQVENKNEADALKKRQFPTGDVVGEMRKQAGREIMADIENKTAETLHGFNKSFAFIPAELCKEYQENEKAITDLANAGKCHTKEFNDLCRQSRDLSRQISEVKKEFEEKEAADITDRMVADVMKVTDSFAKAAKAMQVFNREAKEADAMRQKFEHLAPKTGGQNPQTGKKYITDEKGFLFVAGNGEILWALHDGAKYCFCNWEGGAWIGWRVSEADVIEAGHTQLPIFLDHFIRSIMPTKHPNKPIGKD